MVLCPCEAHTNGSTNNVDIDDDDDDDDDDGSRIKNIEW
jgi:hypothetical protein